MAFDTWQMGGVGGMERGGQVIHALVTVCSEREIRVKQLIRKCLSTPLEKGEGRRAGRGRCRAVIQSQPRLQLIHRSSGTETVHPVALSWAVWAFMPSQLLYIGYPKRRRDLGWGNSLTDRRLIADKCLSLLAALSVAGRHVLCRVRLRARCQCQQKNGVQWENKDETIIGIIGRECVWWGVRERLQLGRHSSSQGLLQDRFLTLGSNGRIRVEYTVCL